MLIDKIEEDLKTALRSKDSLKLGALRMLKAAIGNYLIEKKKDKADDSEVTTLIQKQVKMRQESIESYKKAGRQELLAKETAEKAFLETYLPQQLSDEELAQIIKSVVSSLGAKSAADTGRVMKEVMPKVQGRADGKRVSQLVTQSLQPSKV